MVTHSTTNMVYDCNSDLNYIVSLGLPIQDLRNCTFANSTQIYLFWKPRSPADSHILVSVTICHKDGGQARESYKTVHFSSILFCPVQSIPLSYYDQLDFYFSFLGQEFFLKRGSMDLERVLR